MNQIDTLDQWSVRACSIVATLIAHPEYFQLNAEVTEALTVLYSKAPTEVLMATAQAVEAAVAAYNNGVN